MRSKFHCDLVALVFWLILFCLNNRLEGIQTRLLANKDKRISIINEVLNVSVHAAILFLKC